MNIRARMLNFIVYLFFIYMFCAFVIACLLTLFGKPESGDDEEKNTSKSRFSDKEDFYREG